MKKIISVFAVVAVLIVLCAGCGETETATPEKAEHPEAHTTTDGDDHSGHNH